MSRLAPFFWFALLCERAEFARKRFKFCCVVDSTHDAVVPRIHDVKERLALARAVQSLAVMRELALHALNQRPHGDLNLALRLHGVITCSVKLSSR